VFTLFTENWFGLFSSEVYFGFQIVSIKTIYMFNVLSQQCGTKENTTYSQLICAELNQSSSCYHSEQSLTLSKHTVYQFLSTFKYFRFKIFCA